MINKLSKSVSSIIEEVGFQMMDMLLRTYEQELQWVRHCSRTRKYVDREIEL